MGKDEIEYTEEKRGIRFSTILFLLAAIAACVGTFLLYRSVSDVADNYEGLKREYADMREERDVLDDEAARLTEEWEAVSEEIRNAEKRLNELTGGAS